MAELENVDTTVQEETPTEDKDTEEIAQEEEVEETSGEQEEEQVESETKEEPEDSDDNEPTSEQLDAMSDEEFIAYMNSGKLPSKSESVKQPVEEEKPTTDKAKVISKPTKTESASKQVDDTTVNYEEAYKRIFSPFKANGKEIRPKTPEDVISLMQMGANYTKKMQAMAPMRKIVESLSNAGIKEEDLNFLIDLHKGDKDAIKQLLKKNEIDTLDLDLDNVNYTPKNNIASDDDVKFSETLADIDDSIPKINEILNTKWDKESKQALLKDPKLLRALHEEIQMGRFDTVQSRLEQEKTFGRYKDVSDLYAYIDLVTRMVNNEKAKAAKSNKATTLKSTKSASDKRKAAPTRTSTSKESSNLTVKDLFSMSEEEFNRLSEKDLV